MIQDETEDDEDVPLAWGSGTERSEAWDACLEILDGRPASASAWHARIFDDHGNFVAAFTVAPPRLGASRPPC